MSLSHILTTAECEFPASTSWGDVSLTLTWEKELWDSRGLISVPT